jgi:hypothetical protein
MIAPFYGQDLLGGPKRGYHPITDWTELTNNKGEGLHIGLAGFDSCSTSFVKTIPCLEVQAGISFMVSADFFLLLL